MKEITLIVLLMLGLKIFAQNNEEDNFFVSVGVHVGFFAFNGQQNELPYQIHIDKLFKKKHVLGIGYSYDTYRRAPFYADTFTTRHNVRIRYYRYFREENRRFAAYLGCSAGYSVWEGKEQYNAEPAMGINIQFLYGFKIKLNESFFSQTEFGLGSPYFAQTSIGMKF